MKYNSSVLNASIYQDGEQKKAAIRHCLYWWAAQQSGSCCCLQTAALYRETYSLDQDTAIEHYNQEMANFYQQQMNVQGDWSQHSVERVESTAVLKGRDRLQEVLKNLGFPLL